MEKKCTKCGEFKSLDDFHNLKSSKDGKQFRCKICRKEYKKKCDEEIKKNKRDNISTLDFIKLFHLNNGLKKCKKCEEVKSLDEFNNSAKGKNGKNSQCRNCNKLYYKNNKDRHSELGKEYRDKNKEKIIKISKEYYKNNKERILEEAKKYQNKNKEKISEKSKEYYKNNKEKINQKEKEYRDKNKEKIKEFYKNNKQKFSEKYKKYRNKNKEKINRRARERRKTNPLFKLRCLITSNIGMSLKNKGYTKKTKTYNMLKCDYNFFMTWLNGVASNGNTYGIGDLHLDHVIPISLAETEDEAYLLNHYSNYQLLSADENLAKGNLYVNPVNLARVLEHHPEPNKIKEIYSRL